MRRGFAFGLIAVVGLLLPALAPAWAQVTHPSLANSFRLGSNSDLLCSVQSTLSDPALVTMFDRAYTIVCRDAASPVGHVYALRDRADPAARLAAQRAGRVHCEGTVRQPVADLGVADVERCTLSNSPVGYTVYRWHAGNTVYVAEGLAGYDSALLLALRSIVADRVIPGELDIATTGLGDPSAFAGIQAGSLDPDQALSEAYRRNNSGNYAEAAEFFETLVRRTYSDGRADASERAGEFLINEALQKSNLGQFDEAEATYARALAIPSASPTQLRLRRNFRALHLMNQRRFEDALAVLDEPLATSMTPGGANRAAEITADMSAEINSSSEIARQLGGEGSERLTVTERAVILDAQARELRGAILRFLGRPGEAVPELSRALADISGVRNGRVRSTARLRAQALAELAAIDEASGNAGSAEARLREALVLMETQYPLAIATSAAKARLAAFLAQRGDTAAALAMFAEVVIENSEQATARTGLENRLAPYFDLLLREMPANASLVNAFFLASETLVRPGVANTQAVLARELSGGSDEASRLFRQSVTLTRAVESARVELARLQALESPDQPTLDRIAALTAQLDQLTGEQTATQARLADFPRYRAVSTQAMTLSDLQASLRPDEAYLKMVEVADTIYLIFATADGATAWRADLDAAALEEKVAQLRETISTVENGVRLTYPFDAGVAYQIFTGLMAPIAPRLAEVRHLIFEPDGAMLRLPLNLLVTDETGLLAYENRLGMPGNDEFDFTGIAWLGRATEVSTAVSARGFRDVRALPPSSAMRSYLGFGDNAPPGASVASAASRGTAGADPRCGWPIATWNSPVSARELRTVTALIGGNSSDIVTGAAFTDEAVIARDDLDQYRIIQFATHGLVTQPDPQCPTQPALLTSFAPDADSDGLLSFGEIFNLRLNADLVILSACDTATAAGIAASKQAGVSGGDSALDGLVRAFVGAGSRTVIASHWPAPDDFGATERLMTGMFEAPPGTPIARAVQQAERTLMDDPQTSHPYYWAGFAIVGDGEQPAVRAD